MIESSLAELVALTVILLQGTPQESAFAQMIQHANNLTADKLQLIV